MYHYFTDLDFRWAIQGVSIRSNPHKSFLLLSISHAGSRFTCIVISRILTSGGLYRVVENVVDSSRFNRIDTNRFPCCRFVMPEVDLRDATPCESS